MSAGQQGCSQGLGTRKEAAPQAADLNTSVPALSRLVHGLKRGGMPVAAAFPGRRGPRGHAEKGSRPASWRGVTCGAERRLEELCSRNDAACLAAGVEDKFPVEAVGRVNSRVSEQIKEG